MRESQLMNLNGNNYLPKTIEYLDFRRSKIEEISPTFFTQLENLIEVNLSENKLKSFDNIEFFSNKFKKLSLEWNEIVTVEEMIFKTPNSLSITIDLIDLSGNKLKKTPSIRGNVNSIKILDMKDQRSRADVYLRPEQTPSIFKDMPLITEKLILRNSSLNAICCRLSHYTMKTIDISYNYLNEETLCELFYNIDQKLEVVLFPQLGDNKIRCRDLKAYRFKGVSFNRDFDQDCKLFSANDDSRCWNKSFPIRYTIKKPINYSIASEKRKFNYSSNIKISYFLNENFTSFLVFYFIFFLLSTLTFLYFYQHF